MTSDLRPTSDGGINVGITSIPLNLPSGSSLAEQHGFVRLCKLLEIAEATFDSTIDPDHWIASAKLGNLDEQPALAAAAHTTIDLVSQGWKITVIENRPLLTSPSTHLDRDMEKARIRRQELIRRDEQLRKPSVRRFVKSMERSHWHDGQLISIFNLMRDGRELASALQRDIATGDAIKPYVQIIDGSSCKLTGFNLLDIWRYFRHTWSNSYASVPGRSMPILIRDAATEHHAVIGLAAISSPVVQIAERDRWMGWETDQFLRDIDANPTIEVAQWFAKRVKSQPEEVYFDDLVRDGILKPADITAPTPAAIALLRTDAERHRQMHYRKSGHHDVQKTTDDEWICRAETDLFRSKRSTALAEALEIASLLGSYLSPTPTVDGLKRALADRKARSQLRRVVRRARGERVGTVIADLTVCGAVAPYNSLAAGKLVGALSVSPTALAAYREKYDRPSEIASAIAGRPILREARLAFVGTTSLYGTGSSQYNRLFWPAEVMGGDTDTRMGFYELGRSRSFGTSHFSDKTVQALVRLAEQYGSIVRVNSLFGEGVSPRLRKVRLGLTALGWPTDDLLKHGRERIVYGVPLVENLRDYSLGINTEPSYLLDPNLDDGDAKVFAWWFERWGKRRSAQMNILRRIETHRATRPVRHGARVPLPPEDGMLPLTFAEDDTADLG